MTDVRTLWLMRHAKAADFVPGRRDIDRPLTERGHAQSAAAGRWLAGRETPPAVVLCSPSLRTRETTADLGLDVAPTDAPGVWEGGPDDIAAELAVVDDAVRTVLVVGHAPGVPALADQLTDRAGSDVDLVAELDRHFPTATVAELELTCDWTDLRPGRLVALHLEH